MPENSKFYFDAEMKKYRELKDEREKQFDQYQQACEVNAQAMDAQLKASRALQGLEYKLNSLSKKPESEREDFLRRYPGLLGINELKAKIEEAKVTLADCTSKVDQTDKNAVNAYEKLTQTGKACSAQLDKCKKFVDEIKIEPVVAKPKEVGQSRGLIIALPPAVPAQVVKVEQSDMSRLLQAIQEVTTKLNKAKSMLDALAAMPAEKRTPNSYEKVQKAIEDAGQSVANRQKIEREMKVKVRGNPVDESATIVVRPNRPK